MKNKLAKIISLILCFAACCSLVSCSQEKIEITVSEDDVNCYAWMVPITGDEYIKNAEGKCIKSVKDFNTFVQNLYPNGLSNEFFDKYNKEFFKTNVLVGFKLRNNGAIIKRKCSYYTIKDNKLTINMIAVTDDKLYTDVIPQYIYLLQIPKEQIPKGLKIEIIVDDKNLQ